MGAGAQQRIADSQMVWRTGGQVPALTSGVRCLKRSGCKPTPQPYGSRSNPHSFVGLLAPAGQCQVSAC
jgi:hypothetical protein